MADVCQVEVELSEVLSYALGTQQKVSSGFSSELSSALEARMIGICSLFSSELRNSKAKVAFLPILNKYK